MQEKPFSQIRVACVLDEFSYEGFRLEGEFLQLEPETWEKAVRQFNPDLLLVESVWEGKNRSWRHRFFSPIDTTLQDIVAWCKRRNIPTVFWNKEDPPNFRLFLNNARVFDYVLTTDINCIPKYKSSLPHDRIDVLQFAAQPLIHNPINRNKLRAGQLAFAGTWHQLKYPQRRKNMEIMLRQAALYDLTIFDRMSSFSANSPYRYPEEFRPYIAPALSYREMIQAYKKYDVFLNVDSVTDSSTMFSRRIFELLAAGTPVISSYAKGIVECFSDVVMICHTEKDWCEALNCILTNRSVRDRLSLKGQRAVFAQHTYRHRFKQILDMAGIASLAPEQSAAVVAFVRNRWNLRSVLNNYLRQSYLNKRLYLFTNRTYWLGEEKADILRDAHIEVCSMPGWSSANLNCGEILKQLPDVYVFFFSEYDYYGPEFMTDMMHAIQYSRAEVAGKATYYSYDAGHSEISVRNPNHEYEYYPTINPWTMVIDKQCLMDDLNDVSVQLTPQRLSQKGYLLYSADRFQYIHNYYALKHNADQQSADFIGQILV